MIKKYMSDMFISNGRSYIFDKDYFDIMNARRPLKDVASFPLFEGNSIKLHQAKTRDVSFMQYLTKQYEASLIIDCLYSVGKLRHFQRALDIGSGSALQLRYLRVTGHVEQADAIDLYDGRQRCPDDLFLTYVNLQSLLNGAYRISSLLPINMMSFTEISKKIQKSFPYGLEEFSYRPNNSFLNLYPRLGKTLDEFLVGDIYSLERKYDLITSFMALDYFKFDEVAKKVANLLQPGGVFAFIVSYWWFPINNTLLYGLFPYLLQQLEPEELKRYYQEFHPELPKAGIHRRLDYSDQRRLTISDYENIAYACGLAPLFSVRLRPAQNNTSRAIINPLEINQRPNWSLSQVLENASQWKSGLSVSDLMTSHVLLAFEKI